MTTRTIAAWSLLCLLVATPAFAQAVRSGPTFAIGGTPLVVTPAIAYDPVHDRYLVVQAHGFVEGLLTNTSGQTLVDFTVNASRGAWAGEYAQTPMVAFAADVNNGAGGFLVTWQESVSNVVTQARGRLVSADGAPLGTDFLISTEATAPGASTNWQMPATLAYSPTSHEFLVAWMGSFGTSNDIRCNRVSAAGAVLQAVPTNVTNTTPDWERDPSVAYNPDADEFFIGYAGYHNAAGYSYVAGQRVKAGTGQPLGGLVEYDQTVATYIPSVTYNTTSHQYLMAWYHATSAGAAVYGIKLNGDGSTASQLIVESSFYASYDALDLKFNSGSGDYLLVTQSHGSEDAAVSITSAGTPYDNGFIATATSDSGNYGPRIAPNPAKGTWLLVTSGGFASVLGQFIQSQNTGPKHHGNGDLTVWRPGSGTWFTLPAASGYASSAQVEHTFGGAGDVPLTGDLDGDGIADLVIWRPSTGMWYWLTSSSGFTFAGQTQWGNQSLGDVPMLADIDGDGKADLIVWRASTGTWYWLTSSSGYAAAGAKQWGNQSLGDVPKLGDIDGDGKADLIVWRGSTGTWFWLTSSSGYNYALQGQKQWGNQSLGDVPMVGDLDGDGNADLVVWRGSTGTWYWLTSSSGYQYGAFGQMQWGNQSLGDVPLLTDMDGDGKADLIVWRASTGWWYWLKSTKNYSVSSQAMMQWGAKGDIPLVNW